MRVLDLFSGIGGFSIGLEKAGFETVAFCEIDSYAQKVLQKNWPGVPIYDDVRTITADRLAADGIGVDVITGGFPCQDISVAGNQAGIADGTRSGLWSECARLIGELRPRYAIFENVTNLLNGERGDWFKRVLWDISALGYDAEWHCIPASAVGAHHRRDRIWIVAYPARPREQARSANGLGNDHQTCGDKGQFASASEQASTLADTYSDDGRRGSGSESPRRDTWLESGGGNAGQSIGEASAIMADTNARLRNGEELEVRARGDAIDSGSKKVADTSSKRVQGSWSTEQQKPQTHVRKAILVRGCTRQRAENWETEPAVGRVVDGFPDRAHRLKCLGNAVVPQIPQIIGKAILEAEHDDNNI